MTVRFEFADSAGTPVTSLLVGNDYELRVHVQDTRGVPTGVVQAYFDVHYPPSLISVQGDVLAGPPYRLGATGDTSTSGLIDEAGGMDTDLVPGLNAGAELLLFSVPVRAIARGDLDLTADLSESNARLPMFFDEAITVPLDNIDFEGEDIEVRGAGIDLSPHTGLETTEAGGTDTFEISLDTQPTASVTIGLSSSDLGEGSVSPSSVTFTPSNWNTPRTVTVSGRDDALVDGNVNYQIITAPATSSDPNYSGKNAIDVSVTNLDDDSAGITVQPTIGQTTEAGGTASFQISLTSQPSANVIISLTSSDTDEGRVSSSSVTFTPANWSSAQVVTVTGQDDSRADGNASYTIVTSAAISDDPLYSGRAVSDVSMTNRDNDFAGISVEPATGQTSEDGGTDTFQIVLNSQPSANVSIGLTSSDVSEGTVEPSSVVFTPTNWNVARTVTVTGQDDGLADGNIAYTIVTSHSSSTDLAYNNRLVADVSMTNLDNDAVGISVMPTTGQTSESGDTATFEIRLTSQPSANVTIGLSSSDPGEGTVSPSSLTITPNTWNSPRSVTVTGHDDELVDGNVTYTILTAPAVSDDATYHGRNAADVSLTNQDNDTVGITVRPTIGQTTEAGGTASFSVVLNSRPTADVVIGLSSSDPSEGTVAPTQVTFTTNTWNTPQNVTVTGQDDNRVDGNTPYSIVTSPAASSDPSYNGFDVANIAMTNLDDDSAEILIITIGSLETTESGGTAQFDIVLASEPSGDVTIGLASNDNGEGSVSPGNVRFTPADWDEPKTVTVTGQDDFQVDGNIGYRVLTAPAASSDPNYNGRNAIDPEITNVDDDEAGLLITAAPPLATSESGLNASFSVALLSQPAAAVTVGVNSSDPTEGRVDLASLSFTTTNWNTAQTVNVTGQDDDDADGDVSYRINVSTDSSDPDFDGLFNDDLVFSNSDDDTPGVTITPAMGLATSEAGASASFLVMLDTRPTANVEIDLASSAPDEGRISANRLTFTPDDWFISKLVTVTGVDDHKIDGEIEYLVVTSPAISNDPNYAGMDPLDVSLTNLDDDRADILVVPTNGLSTTEAGGMATFTVALATEPAADVSLGLTSSNTDEVAVTPSGVTFTAANWNVPQTVTLTGQDDLVSDGDVLVEILTSAASSSDAAYDGLDPDNVTVVNIDNDVPGITVSPTSGLITTEAGGVATFEVVLNVQPTESVMLDLSSDNLNEGTVSRNQLTFTTTNWKTPQTITITGTNDDRADGDVTYHVITTRTVSSDASYNNLDVPDVSVTNTDDDVAGVNVVPISGLVTTEAGTAATFEIRLTSEPTGNVSLSATSNNTHEGTVSPGNITFTTTNWDISRVITVTGVDDNVDDDDVTFSVVTSVISSGDSNYANLTPDDVEVVNVDDDVAAVIVSPTSGLITDEQGALAEFTIRLASQPTAAVRIPLASSDTEEGSLATSEVIFTPGNWSLPQTVVVTGEDDDIFDGNRLYSVITSAAISTDPKYGGMDADDVELTNNDNDSPGILLAPLSGLQTSEDQESATFQIRLSTRPSSDVTLAILSSDPTEGTASEATVRFSSTTWDVPQTVTVIGRDDAIMDGSVAYDIIVEVATTTDPGYAGLEAIRTSLTNLDNDIAGVRISAASGATTTEAGGTVEIAVVLTAEPNANVAVQLVSRDETEGVVETGNVTFSSMNWDVPQTVTVTGVDDPLVDGDVPFAIVARTSSTDPNYESIESDDFAVINQDDDSATLTLAAASTVVPEGTGGGNALATFTVELTGDVEGGFTLAYTLDDGTATAASGDYVDDDGFVEFSGTSGESHQVTVEVISDNLVEPDETFAVALQALSNIIPSAASRVTMMGTPLEFQIFDDDDPAISFSGVSLAEGTGGTTTFSFLVALSNPVQGGMQIRYMTNDGTATIADGDYVDNDGVLNFTGPTAEQHFISVQVNADAKVERDESFVVTLEEITFLDPVLADLFPDVGGGSRTGAILNDDTATISFADTSSFALEMAGTHTVPVRLSVTGGGTLSEDTTIQVSPLAGNSAVIPDDYTLPNTVVTFPAGSADGATRPIELFIVADEIIEGDETISLGIALNDDGIGSQVSIVAPNQHDVRVSEDPMTASITGRVWLDGNNKGSQDPGEIGIPGVSVVLTGTSLQNQPVEAVVMTDSDGQYQIDALPAGTYQVREIQPKALTDGVDTLGTVDGVPSGVVGNDQFSNIVLAPGQQGVGYNFGERGLVQAPTSRRFFLASTPPLEQVIREVVARGEELAGDVARANEIRRGEAVEMRRIGSQVTFMGTSLNDLFAFVPASNSSGTGNLQHGVVANGVRWEFSEAEVDTFILEGALGDDEIELHDSTQDDLLEASRDIAILSSGGFRVEAAAFELVRAISSSGGNDVIRAEAIDFTLEQEGPWTT